MIVIVRKLTFMKIIKYVFRFSFAVLSFVTFIRYVINQMNKEIVILNIVIFLLYPAINLI